jgi:hypothetical protein
MMQNETTAARSHESPHPAASGWPVLALNIFLLAGGMALLIFLLARQWASPGLITLAVLMNFTGVLCLPGYFALQPNQARVLLLFGAYKGTVRATGFHWTNPFYTKRRMSLRARNLVTEKLKVNDKRGNPIEIGAVVVWRVRDSAQATFDVENYESYVPIQSESAVRHLASAYDYDSGGVEGGEPTLLSSGDAVAAALRNELQERLDKAGIWVEETRLTHLAYAPEIAQTMLRRQQAEAVIAARQKIVHGAVGMVEMALEELAKKDVVHLDDERKAAMVSNLLVVLCGESEAKPVVNVGTLYN